jgi:peptidoglycan/xylan/chitin deacetylase (PgdA/CDA1 family)
MAQKIIALGHDLGNHTATHTQMKTISAPRVVSEIHGCASALTKEIGYAGKWFRPSGTQYSTALIRKKAAQFGYPQCISYDVDSLDYQDPGAATVVAADKKHIKPGSIVSMHFGHQDTVSALPTILALLKKKGLAPVTLTELLAPMGITPSHRAIK